ncbi:hypothetical protein BBO99_00005108 [Phytophthora kernoviae]|uniref:Major facilitator superfamily (MFS) profile domain-containing protein n=2 Tax=Phytophthora kernoviae TaxID=325452 RepID=A0A3R7IP61_9STRA|nr:hypothetical protein G195_008363 [Phytophthora kernoviae 00238/432]KAG2519394.1 hypothetical protein JM16_007157 [Phytophthora kernoviae]RLN44348.1 hypothetical protein BBI17_005211 [Phytophthora kernoviae]RLN79660.1 hypothetical protein BBO99_00005108 [Phytophthora kernoviae]
MSLSQCNGTDECNARPVAENTCLMFPGHSKLEWTFAVNAWLFGAMVESLCCGHFIDKYGGKKALMGNYLFMIVGDAVQAAVSNVCTFSDAGISDLHVGTLIVNSINIWSAFFTGVLANCFGARNMILWGLADMVAMSIGMDDGR